MHNIISGSFYNLRKMGFNVNFHDENRLLDRLEIDVRYDVTGPGSEITAFTEESYNGKAHRLYVNAGHQLIMRFPSRIAKNWAILGLVYHEIGHLLYTDFPTLRAWKTQLGKGIWFPVQPENLNTINGINLSNQMNDSVFNRILARYGGSLHNALEDAYIEEEMKELCPGNGAGCLATINSALIESAPTLEESVNDNECSDFSALSIQLLLYAKFGEAQIGDYDGELADVFFECVDIIEDIKYERDPKKRIQAVNELLCVMFPYLNEEIEEAAKQLQNNPLSPGQCGDSSGGNNGGLPPEIEDVFDSLLSQLEGRAGASASSDCTTKALTNPERNHDAPATQDPENMKGNGFGGGTGGTPDMNAGEFTRLENEIAKDLACAQAENERTAEMNAEATNINCTQWGVEGSVSVQVDRAAQVSQSNINEYTKLQPQFEGISRDLQRGIARILKDRREGGKRKNLAFGRRLEVPSIIHKDGKYFSRNRMPTESPRLGVGILVDESGSTDGVLIRSAKNAALVLEDFCRELKIPHIINGYTSAGGVDAQIFSYAEPDEIDDGNRFRITGMKARGGTPTAAAMIYLLQRLEKLEADIRLMVVITDGASSDNYDPDSEIGRIKRILLRARKDNTIIIAAGVGNDKESIKKEFGDNFLPIDDLEEMPELLCQIIKTHLWV